MDIKMINVGRKGGYCLIILKNMLGLLGPNNLLLMPVLRSQKQRLKVFQRSLVRQGQVNLLQKEVDFFALRHKNTIPGNFPLKRQGSSSMFRGGEGAVAGTSAAASAAQQIGSLLVPQLSKQLS